MFTIGDTGSLVLAEDVVDRRCWFVLDHNLVKVFAWLLVRVAFAVLHQAFYPRVTLELFPCSTELDCACRGWGKFRKALGYVLCLWHEPACQMVSGRGTWLEHASGVPG